MKDGGELGAIPWRPRPGIPRDLQKHVVSLSRQQRPDLGGQKGIDGRTEGSRQWGCSRGGVGGEDCQRAVWRRKMGKAEIQV